MTQYERIEAARKLKHDRELDAILDDSTITHCYIKKSGSYYCDNYSGYTELRIYAGVYTKEDAVKDSRGCIDEVVVPIKTVFHNQYLKEQIEAIKSHLIN